jgi:hypothetical protein
MRFFFDDNAIFAVFTRYVDGITPSGSTYGYLISRHHSAYRMPADYSLQVRLGDYVAASLHTLLYVTQDDYWLILRGSYTNAAGISLFLCFSILLLVRRKP